LYFLVGLGKNSLEDTCLESDGYKWVSAFQQLRGRV
jgi:hypothetical protein